MISIITVIVIIMISTVLISSLLYFINFLIHFTINSRTSSVTHFFIIFQAGYKTLGVAVKFNDEPFRFVGILPMLDPPRHDTAHTIKNLVAAGIVVKVTN